MVVIAYSSRIANRNAAGNMPTRNQNRWPIGRSPDRLVYLAVRMAYQPGPEIGWLTGP
jgi:hypothetical protein